MDRDKVSFHKKKTGQYLAFLNEQDWSINDSLRGQNIIPKNLAFAGTKRASGRVANQNTGFASSCPLWDSAIQYNCGIKSKVERTRLLITTNNKLLLHCFYMHSPSVYTDGL